MADGTIYYNKAVQIMKDLDTSGGRIAAYFATFDDIDKHGRKMDENAFRRTIKNNAQRWYHLFNHNTSAIIGKIEDAGTDDKGAFFVSKLLNTSLGKDVMEMYKEGILNEHSFGFEIVHSIQMNSYEHVKEVKVHEVSSVTFAANPAATTISVNSIMDFIEKNDKSGEALERINYMVGKLEPEAMQKNMQALISSGNNDMQLQILSKLDSIANLLRSGAIEEKQSDQGGVDSLFDFIDNY